MQDIPLIFNLHSIAAGSMAANLSTGPISLDNITGYCVQAIWTGLPVGNVIIEGSNDGIHFSPISTTATGGVAGSLLQDIVRANYVFAQVRFAFTSGSGTLDALISGKK